MSILRNLLCWLMPLLFPLSLLAADTNSAMLHGTGGVWIDGKEAPNSIAIFPGNELQTKARSIANLESDGSSVQIQPESLVTFNGDSLTLEHGTVSVGTSKSLSVHIHCLLVVPVSNEWTQYSVTDVDGSVQVVANKKDVNIRQESIQRKASATGNASQSATVHEGEHAKRDESEACGAAERPRSPTHTSNTKWIEIGSGTGVGVLVLCLLLCSGTSSQPISPWQP